MKKNNTKTRKKEGKNSPKKRSRKKSAALQKEIQRKQEFVASLKKNLFWFHVGVVVVVMGIIAWKLYY